MDATPATNFAMTFARKTGAVLKGGTTPGSTHAVEVLNLAEIQPEGKQSFGAEERHLSILC